MIAQLTVQARWPDPIVTQVEPVAAFYPAEDEHQDFYRRHPFQGYCRAVISPKLAKLRSGHADLLLE